MTPTAPLVHLGLPDPPILISLLHNAHHDIGIARNVLLALQNLHQAVAVLAKLQIHPAGLQQIVHLLVVDLQVRDSQEKLSTARLGDGIEHVIHGHGDDPGLALRTHHGMSLARAGLAVGEYGAVEALDRRVDDRLDDRLEDIVVRLLRVEYVICGNSESR